jgi:fatty acid-binding protein DegV
MHNNILSSSHTILGAMLSIKPFLTLEDGEIKPIEKVRTRAQAIERLVEFAVEFTDIEDALILHNRARSGEQARMLQDRLVQEFPGQHFAIANYSPALACLIGADAAGIVVMEKELDSLYDGL